MSDQIPVQAGLWYYARNGKKTGPLSLSALKQLAEAGQLQPSDMVLEEGTTKWVAAQAVPGLFTAEPSTVTFQPPGIPTISELLPPRIRGAENQKNVVAPSMGGVLPSVDFSNEPIAQVSEAVRVTIPGYEILGVLGRGGMGVVYKARHLQLDRVVALKMILAGGHASESALQRFRTEAQAVARLQHPGIVQIHEVGSHEGLPYFSLEYCGGGGLDKRLSGTPLSPVVAARLVESLARAVHVAHQQHVVHRDLKPGNILMSGENDDGSSLGTPKIADFGLARKLDQPGQTVTGAIVGTPSYMAPEQASGQAEAIGPATDIYALGAILYECLVGRPPFRASTPLDTLMQVMSDEPVPPSQLQSATPRDLETICLKCLQKPPLKRYGTALDLAEDLRRYQANEPILARPVSVVERASKWVKRRPAIAALLAAVMLITAVGLIGVLWALDLAIEQRNQAQTNAKNEKIQRERAEESEGAFKEKEKEARREKLRAERERDEGARQLLQARHNLFNVKLFRARSLLESDPAQTQQFLQDCDNFPLDLREFTWNLHVRWCRRDHLSLPGHQIWDVGLAYSKDGKTLFTSGKEVKLWDLSTGQERMTLKNASGPMTMSVDGKTLATSSDDGTIKLFDTTSGQEVAAFKGKQLGITCLALSPDGKTLAAASGGEGRVIQPGKPLPVELKFWDVPSGEERASLKGHKYYITSLAFSPDGKTLASGSQQRSFDIGNLTRPGELILWDVETARERVQLKVNSSGISDLAISGDGNTLVSADELGAVRLWDLATNKVRASLSLSKEGISPVGCVALSKDGQILAASHMGKLVLWDLATTTERLTLPVGARRLAFSPDGRTLAAASSQSTMLWDVIPRREGATLQAHTKSVNKIVFSPDGKTMASGGADKTIKLWDRATGQQRAVLNGHTGEVYNLAFSSDGKNLTSHAYTYHVNEKKGWFTGEVKRWNLATNKVTATMPIVARSVVFSPDGQAMVWWTSEAGNAPKVKLWDLVAVQERAILQGAMRSAAFSPDSKTLATAGFNLKFPVMPGENGRGQAAPIVLWDVATGEKRTTMEARAHHLAYSPDGKTLAASDNKSIKLLDADSGQERFTLLGHRATVSALDFSPDGKTLLSHAVTDSLLRIDGETMLWDVATGQRRASLGNKTASCLAFSPDGKTLATGGSTPNKDAVGVLKLWDVYTGEELVTLQGAEVSADAGAIRLDGSSVASVAFSPDGKTLASGSAVMGLTGGGILGPDVITNRPVHIKLWEFTPRPEKTTLKCNREGVNALAFSPDGKTLAYGSAGHRSFERIPGSVKLWDTTTGQERPPLDETAPVSSIAYSSDGKFLAYGIEWKDTPKSNPEPLDPAKMLPQPLPLPFADPGAVILRDLTTGKDHSILRGHNTMVLSVAFSPDNKTLASGSFDGIVKLWDMETGQEIATLRCHQRGLRSLAFRPDGKTLATTGDGRDRRRSFDDPPTPERIKLWDLDTRKERITLVGGGNGLAFSPDGKLLAGNTNSPDGPREINVWDADTGEKRATFKGQANCVAYSPDGKTLASGSDKTIKLWDLATDREVAVLRGHNLNVVSVAFSPDGKTLASGAEQGGFIARQPAEIKLWDLAAVERKSQFP